MFPTIAFIGVETEEHNYEYKNNEIQFKKKKTFNAYDQRPKRCNITELSLQLYTGAANLMCHFIIINVIRRNPGSSF